MKNLKLMMMTLMMLLSTVSYSQNKVFTTYTDVFGDTCNIKLMGKDTTKYHIWIKVHSIDDSHKVGGIMVSNKSENMFISSLTKAKAKYIEWLTIAKNNDVKDLYKEMEIQCKGIEGYFLYGKDFHFQFNVKLKFSFMVREKDGEITYRLVIKTGEMTASDNQFMKVDGVVLVFNSEKEIQDFIDTLDHKKIIEYLSKPKAEDLFKN
jgi:hypothetical protein